MQLCTQLFLVFYAVWCCAGCDVSTSFQDKLKRAVNEVLMDDPNRKQTITTQVEFYIESMSNIDVTEMSYTLDLYLHVRWLDPRLCHNSDEPKKITDMAVVNKMWKPDLYFANAKKSTKHDAIVPNQSMRINRHGTIYFSTRLTLDLHCDLNLRDYPMDEQICTVKLLSYSHSKEELDVKWGNDSPIRYNDEIDLPEMTITKTNSTHCVARYKDMHSINVDKYSCLLAEFYLARRSISHIVQTFVPTALIVITSWLAFFIDPASVPARVTLAFTTLLTLSTMAAGLRMSLPAVSYLKAMDTWIGVCTTFIFGVLLEFAIVNNYLRKAHSFEEIETRLMSKRHVDEVKKEKLLTKQETLSTSQARRGSHLASSRRPSAPATPQITTTLPLDPFLDCEERRKRSEEQPSLSVIAAKHRLRYRHIARRIDAICVYAFPATFLVFNLVFWSVYTPKA